ncbi:MAG: ArnT family glycosyltransferase [Candidatus Goldiibacteriota bacterium]
MRSKIFFIISALAIIRLVYINFLPLLGDEAYYWQWARHLAPGYYEQGPVLALVIWLFTLFTNISNLFTLRLGAVVLSTATMLISILILKKITPGNPQKSALWFLLLINASIIYSIGSVLMMHDTVMIFFYSLFILQMLRITENQYAHASRGQWAGAGAVLALGVMSKYTLILLYPAAAFFLILSGGFRKNLKGFSFFTASFILFLSPVIFWNIANDMATLKYLFLRSGGSGAGAKYIFEFIGAQILLAGPALTAAAALPFIRHIKRPSASPFFMFSVFFVFAFLPFLILSLHTKTEANWPAFAFLPLFYMAAVQIPGFRPGIRKFILFLAVITGLIPVLLIHLQAAFSLFPLPERMNPLRKSAGYKEAAALLDKNMRKFSSSGSVFASSRHYQTASAAAFYSEEKYPVYVFLAHESSKNYRFWNDFSEMKGSSSVFLYEQHWEFNDASKFFRKSTVVDSIRVIRDNNETRTFYIGFLENFNPAKAENNENN